MRCFRRGPKESWSRLQDSTFAKVSVAIATSKLASKRIGITLTFTLVEDLSWEPRAGAITDFERPGLSMSTAVIQVPFEIVQKWQEIVNIIAEIVHVPSALVMKVDPPNIKVFVSSELNGNPYERDELAPLNTGLYCETVMKTRQVERRHVVPLAVAAAHAISGVAILAGAHSVMQTTPLYILGLLVNDPTAAIILIVTAVLAVIPYLMRKPPHVVFMALLLPQQCLLLMHFVSAVTTIVSGQYPDGYIPAGGAAFILADQIWLLTIVAAHTFEYVELL